MPFSCLQNCVTNYSKALLGSVSLLKVLCPASSIASHGGFPPRHTSDDMIISPRISFRQETFPVFINNHNIVQKYHKSASLPLFRHHPHANQSETDYLKTLPRIKKDKDMKKTLSDQKRCFAGGTFFCEFISPLPFSVLLLFVFQFQSKADLARLMYG